MIQRIQTVYLLLVIGICISMFFIPVYMAEFHCKGAEIVQTVKLINNKAEYSLGFAQGLGQLNRLSGIYGTLNMVILALAIVDLILYKNRHRQLLLSRFLLAFSIIYLGLIYYTIYFGGWDPFCEVKGHMQAGAFLPILSPILLFLAGRGISKDINLVRSADRLR